MRLSLKYRRTIKKYFNEFFEGELYLFGSRVDDAQKGGDIDLYICPHNQLSAEELFDRKLKFLSKLQMSLGEQKIDIVIAKDKNRGIEQEAIKNGVLL
ncbi:MAG: nucleotidyltransferase domain-containing protein [Methyloprofundus sp.]|nr:nucleotidyltransferase domain-containing protein [Methyloprofundus sp.]